MTTKKCEACGGLGETPRFDDDGGCVGATPCKTCKGIGCFIVEPKKLATWRSRGPSPAFLRPGEQQNCQQGINCHAYITAGIDGPDITICCHQDCGRPSQVELIPAIVNNLPASSALELQPDYGDW